MGSFDFQFCPLKNSSWKDLFATRRRDASAPRQDALFFGMAVRRHNVFGFTSTIPGWFAISAAAVRPPPETRERPALISRPI
jgi:hypothetical protein